MTLLSKNQDTIQRYKERILEVSTGFSANLIMYDSLKYSKMLSF
jgi:hypothetical protein